MWVDSEHLGKGTQPKIAPLTLLGAIQTSPSVPQQANAAKVYDDLKRALSQNHPDEMVVRELFSKLKKISLTVADVVWTVWKTPLTELGIVLETRSPKGSGRTPSNY
jgi:hypothetical protein